MYLYCTCTHRHTHREREREGGREGEREGEPHTHTHTHSNIGHTSNHLYLIELAVSNLVAVWFTGQELRLQHPVHKGNTVSKAHQNNEDPWHSNQKGTFVE